MTTPLNSNPVSALALEESVFTLLEEWLRRWFDGAPHAIGAHVPEVPLTTQAPDPLLTQAAEELVATSAGILFPTALLRFQQSSLPELGQNLGLTAVWVGDSVISKRWENVAGEQQEMVTATANWFFLVRAEGKANERGDNRDKRCRTGADLLFALLQNSHATRALAQKGMSRFRPQTPRLMSEGKTQDKPDHFYSLRMVPCRAQLRYAVLSQVAAS